MHTRKRILLAAMFVAGLLGCHGSGGGDGGAAGFPYAGPACSGSEYGAACWSCTESHCAPNCIEADCSAYLSCFCACDAGDGHCAGGCEPRLSQACETCIGQVGTCQQQSCSSPCSGGSGSGGGG